MAQQHTQQYLEDHRESKLVDRVVDMYYRDPSPQPPPHAENYSRPGGGARWL
jgi:hypothetical protein